MVFPDKHQLFIQIEDQEFDRWAMTLRNPTKSDMSNEILVGLEKGPEFVPCEIIPIWGDWISPPAKNNQSASWSLIILFISWLTWDKLNSKSLWSSYVWSSDFCGSFPGAFSKCCEHLCKQNSPRCKSAKTKKSGLFLFRISYNYSFQSS